VGKLLLNVDIIPAKREHLPSKFDVVPEPHLELKCLEESVGDPDQREFMVHKTSVWTIPKRCYVWAHRVLEYRD
jgi:hypothetical protein